MDETAEQVNNNSAKEIPVNVESSNKANDTETGQEGGTPLNSLFPPQYNFFPLKVIHASRTVRGAFHKNEDRHSIYEWDDWPIKIRNMNHLKNAFEKREANEPQDPSSPGRFSEASAISVSVPVVPDLTQEGPLAGQNLACPSDVPRPRAHSTDITQPKGGMYTGPTAVPEKMYPEDVSTERAFLWTCADGHDGPAAAEFVTSQIGPVLKACWEYETTIKGFAVEGRPRNMTEGSESPTTRTDPTLNEVIDEPPGPNAEDGDQDDEEQIVNQYPEEEEGDDACNLSREKSYHQSKEEEELLLETFRINEEEEPQTPLVQESMPKDTEESDEMALRKLVSVFQRTYHELERKYIHAVRSRGKAALVSRLVNSGSCVSSLFLLGNFLVCSGLGDCRALVLTLDHHSSPKQQTRCDLAPSLARGFESSEGAFHFKRNSRFLPNTPNYDDGQGAFRFVWLNVAHRASLEEETRRITKLGGNVINGRVDGILEPSRTIGDLDVKWSQPPGVLSVIPDVRAYQVTAPVLVFLATDGIWDVLKPKDILHMIQKNQKLCSKIITWLSGGSVEVPATKSYATDLWRFVTRSSNSNAQSTEPTVDELSNLCEQLIRRSRNKKSTDDITLFSVFLRPYPPQEAQKSAGQ
eukprot:GHVP01066674.1.p1 GENE.GHVP01066674.1~~GHVP01066674.1.p1  ORF type:complete len:638 (+),score=99.11 GHVP01066674.1:655-2568(+)